MKRAGSGRKESAFMAYNVFIDGKNGTTGLKIREYLEPREDIHIIDIDEDKRKDMDEKVRKIKEADVSILCLPDQAAVDTAAAAPPDARIIDTSTAHRVNDNWTYGMPELCPGQREKIKDSTRVANPGCHASGFILLVRPLVDAGIIPKDYPLSAFSVTGYSGGGKKMIANHEKEDRDSFLVSPGQYALEQHHKHLPEMVKATGITAEPSFCPIVGDYYAGMVVTVPLQSRCLTGTPGISEIREVFRKYYAGEKLIEVADENPEDGFIHSDILAGSNKYQIFVSGNDERPLLISRFDNLGKGASGAAVQNMNIMLGIDETKGLL